MIPVNVFNFVRAESDGMFAALMGPGGVGTWHHVRTPTPVDDQSVIRMNRDTLYSSAVVDLRAGAVLRVPEHGDRYMSVMVLTRDHHVTRVIHGPGEHRLEPGDDHALLLARTLVDPADPADVAAVNALQDGLAVEAGSATPFTMPEYDSESLTTTRDALLVLARGMSDASGAFGASGEVDPLRHLLGTAYGWGGLPESEAVYDTVEPGLPVGRYRIRVGRVPVDGFWSITVYDAGGHFAANDRDVYSVNSVTARRDPDGSVTVHLGGCGDGVPNCIPLPEGWNYVVRMYRPHPEVVDGTWSFPAPEALTD